MSEKLTPEPKRLKQYEGNVEEVGKVTLFDALCRVFAGKKPNVHARYEIQQEYNEGIEKAAKYATLFENFAERLEEPGEYAADGEKKEEAGFGIRFGDIRIVDREIVRAGEITIHLKKNGSLFMEWGKVPIESCCPLIPDPIFDPLSNEMFLEDEGGLKVIIETVETWIVSKNKVGRVPMLSGIIHC